ncbi:hypothetical protein DICPUDRAFT_33357, partial [Dictyostelium purpureum]
MRRKRNNTREAYFIRTLLKNIGDQKYKIAAKSVDILISISRDFIIRVVEEAFNILNVNKKKTLTPREIQTSIRLNLKGDLAKIAITQGLKAVTKFNDDKKNTGLTINPNFIKRKVKQMNYSCRITMKSMVYLTASLEFFLSEIIELSINNAQQAKRVLVSPREILLSVKNDLELYSFFGDKSIFPGGGVVPLIN